MRIGSRFSEAFSLLYRGRAFAFDSALASDVARERLEMTIRSGDSALRPAWFSRSTPSTFALSVGRGVGVVTTGTIRAFAGGCRVEGRSEVTRIGRAFLGACVLATVAVSALAMTTDPAAALGLLMAPWMIVAFTGAAYLQARVGERALRKLLDASVEAHLGSGAYRAGRVRVQAPSDELKLLDEVEEALEALQTKKSKDTWDPEEL